MFENKLHPEIEAKLRQIHKHNVNNQELKNQIEDYFTQMLEYSIDDGENYDLEDCLNEIFDHDVNDIDEAISRLKEELRTCEFQVDAEPETQAPETVDEQHHNKRLAYIVTYVQDEIDFYQDDDNANRGISDEELNNQINTTYACINAICDAGIVFGGITPTEAAACRTLFHDAFPDQIKI